MTPDGDSYVGLWSASDANVGLTQSEVEDWVASALNGSEGWTQTGITFSNIGTGGVVFRSVGSLPGNAIGMCYYDTSPPRVDLLASWAGNKDLVNHEAAHAFFFASHSPEGSASIMEPIEDPGEEWPSEVDLEQVARYLGLPWPPDAPAEGAAPEIALAPGLYWHPLDLGGYKTRWDLSSLSQVRLMVPVVDARTRGAEEAPVLSTVYSSDPEAAIGDWLPLGASVEVDGMRIHDSGWQPLSASGDIYIGATLRVPLPLDALTVGAADIRLR